MTVFENKNSAIDWLELKRTQTSLSYSMIPWNESEEWLLNDGFFSHITGGFFSVCGINTIAQHQALNQISQPIIDQPEIGILGFIVKKKKKTYQWLLQAKAEPGNIGIVQLAPTVQATYSNYTQKHGGKATPYLENFIDQNNQLYSNTLQSEQGTKFLRKFNRNMVCDAAPQEVHEHFQWFDVSEIQKALRTDYSLNTDARSVITTTPWSLMTNDVVPYSKPHHSGLFWNALCESYNSIVDYQLIGKIKLIIKRLRQTAELQVKKSSVDMINGWQLDSRGLSQNSSTKSPISCFRFYRIHALGREIENWSQPLSLANEEDIVILFCQVRDGVLRFLLRPSFEAGLTGGIEIGPSYQKSLATVSPHEILERVRKNDFDTIIKLRQSDEGGRFMLNITEYAVGLIPENIDMEDNDDNFWLSLAELEMISRTEKQLTNEARSVISLLIGYA